VYYTVDSTKRTYGEHWRIQSPNLQRFLVAAFCKLLGIRQRHRFAIRRPDALNIHATPDIPRLVRQELAGKVTACEDLGLAFQFYGSVDATIGTRAKAYLAALLDEDRQSWASVLTALIWGTHADRVQPAKLSCFSLLPDGTYLVTTDHVWKLVPHPGDLVEYVVDAPEAVVAAHRRRLSGLNSAPVIMREEALADAILAREQRHVDRQVQRGVYVPMTGEEIEQAFRRERSAQ
jgi:hypothetical protein